MIVKALQRYKKHAGTYLRFSGWMLIPTALAFASNALLPEAAQRPVNLFAYAILLPLIVSWSFAAITLFTEQKNFLPSDALHRLFPALLTIIITLIFVFAGLSLLIIPGIIFFLWFGLAPTVSVLERRAPFQALQRAKQLSTSELFFTTLFILVAYFLATALLLIIEAHGNIPEIPSLITRPPALPFDILYRLVDVLLFPLIPISFTLLYLKHKSG